MEKSWKKETERKEEEVNFLKAHGIDYEIKQATDIGVEASVKIIVRNFPFKETLKSLGFYYNCRKRQWEKKIKANEYNAELTKLSKHGITKDNCKME